MSTATARIVEQLKSSVAGGRHWYVALLEAIRAWSAPQEHYDGRHYRYLIDNEVFDWLALAERLCEELDGLIPDNERVALLFFGKPPVAQSRSEFRSLIGASKYRSHLNYFYGVLVERFLILAVTEAIRKERRVAGLIRDDGIADEAYRRIYGADQATLLREFRRQKNYPQLRSIDLDELDEFTYWLFKRRVERADKSCVASDTKKALGRLHELAAASSRSSSTRTTGSTMSGA
ncbi:MAG: hypothetical protein ACNA7X_05990 [Dehalococcoidia bacterium]